MKNLLIVESENDKFFIAALIAHMNLENIEISNGTICKIDDVECRMVFQKRGSVRL